MPRTNRYRFLVIAVFLLLTGYCSLLTGYCSLLTAFADDAADLKAVVDKFFAAYAKKDLDGFMALWSQKSPDYASRKQLMKQLFEGGDYIFGDLVISRIKIEVEKASLRVHVDLTTVDLETKQSHKRRLVNNLAFVKEESGWKVRHYAPAATDLAVKLMAAATEEEGKALLAEEKELVTTELRRALIGQGNRLFMQGSYPRALVVYHLAKSVAEQINDEQGMASALHNIGMIYDMRGDFELALKFYKEGLTKFEILRDDVGMTDSWGNLGALYYSHGNYRLALEHYQKSLILREKLSNSQSLIPLADMDNRRKIASLLNNIGVLYETQGNYEQALNYYQKSLELAKTLENDRGIARTLNNMGVIHYRQRHYDLALQCYHESLTLKKSSEDQVGIANTLQNIGEVHRRQGNYAQALRSYQESLGLWKTMEAKAGIASALSSMGDVYKAQREYPQALDFYQKSLTLAEDVGDPDAIFRCYWDFGEVYREQGRKQEAIAAYQKAVEMIESMRSQVAGNEQEQQRFFEDRVSPYYKVVELLIEQNNFTQALTYAERAKARVLLDVLQSGRVNVTKAMTDAEREKERKLNNELVSLNMQIQREKDDTRRADLRASLDNRRLEYEAFRTSLYASHPELKVKRGEVEPITLNEAYALLSDAKTALLEFVVAEEKTFLFVLTKSPQPTLKVYPINITRKDLAQRTERFRQQLAYNDLSRFPRSARALFDLLLKPAQAQLQGKTTLCMVPDRELWELPFQALQPKENHYLIADAAVFYAPSLTALREMRKRSQQKTSTPLTLLAFGNPTFGKATVERVQLARRDETLDPLPEAEEEVKQLGQLYGAKQSRVYFGAAAQEGRAKSDAGQCQVLHFATHGILDNSSPMYSRIVLSQAEGNTAEDGLLEAWELMNLDLKADLVVLSACQTARGRAASGEGMIGLTWALFVAGCPTTVASQWSVKSDSTKELMIEFHRQLQSAIRNPQSKITKAEALRQAMVKMVRRQDNYKYPHFWAGFVLAGDGG